MNPLSLPAYFLYLLTVSDVTRSENTQVLQSSLVCHNKHDIRTLYGTRICLSEAECLDEKHRPGVNCFRESFNIKKVQLGGEIRGINVTGHVSAEQITRIREDVHKYKLLIFKNQGVVSGERQVEISRWFGELVCTLCDHHKSPHPDVLRVSNDEKQGHRNVGRSCWHIDGSYLAEPFSYSIYHMVALPNKGNTVFVSLKDVIDTLSPETRKRWDHLWVRSKRFDKPVYHPLIYTHPISKQPTLSLHILKPGRDYFIWYYGTELERKTNDEETREIDKEIQREINKDDLRLVYSHKWEPGDFIISDNLALGHMATPETQWPVSEIGLRVLHRTTVRGVHRPQK